MTAEDGTEKDYNLKITVLESSTKTKYVKVNTGVVKSEKDGQTYKTFISYNSERANIEIKAESEYAEIEVTEIINGANDVEENITRPAEEIKATGTLQFNIETPEEVTEIRYKVTSQSGETKENTIILTKISIDNSLKELWVDGELIEPDVDDGNYYVSIENAKTVLVKAVTYNEYAKVRINYEEEQIHETESLINASKSINKVTITVTSQSGITYKYYLYIQVEANNTDLDKVIIDGTEITDYNEDTETYTGVVDNTKDSYEIFLMAVNNEATVELYDGEEIIASGIGSVTNIITLESEEEGHDYKIKVSLDEEHYSEYNLKVARKSNDTSLKIVEVNDIIRQPTIEDPYVYEVGISELAETVKIRIQTNNDYAMVQIGDNEPVRRGETVIIEVDLKDSRITVPVVVTAVDGTTVDTYNIILIRQSKKTELQSVVVNDEELENIDDVYTYYLKNGEDNAHVEILTPENNNAEIEVEERVGIGYLEFDEDVTSGTIKIEKKIKVTSEDGTVTKEYTLIISRITQITGKITTENYIGRNIATVRLYRRRKREDEYGEYEDEDDGELITEIETNEDGTYVIDIDEVGVYDVLVTKSGYLSYKVAEIDIKPGAIVELQEYALIAGDIVGDDEIEINDLVNMNRNVGIELTDENREEKEIYDLNEDGNIDMEDRNILKKNYGKRAEEVKWVNPNPEIQMMNLDLVEDTNIVGANEMNGRPQGAPTMDNTMATEDDQNLTSHISPLILPMACEYRISSEYGTRVHPVTGETKTHHGIDIVGVHHTEILSVADGTIIYAGTINGYGNCIEIKHIVNGETIYSFYAHLSEIDVKVGEKVVKGQVIGKQGGGSGDPNPGTSTGEHLHFEIRTDSGSGNSIDPRKYIEI